MRRRASPRASSRQDRPFGLLRWIRHEHQAINAMRVMDAVEAAASGRRGTPRASPPAGYAVWSRFLSFIERKPLTTNDAGGQSYVEAS